MLGQNCIDDEWWPQFNNRASYVMKLAPNRPKTRIQIWTRQDVLRFVIGFETEYILS